MIKNFFLKGKGGKNGNNVENYQITEKRSEANFVSYVYVLCNYVVYNGAEGNHGKFSV